MYNNGLLNKRCTNEIRGLAILLVIFSHTGIVHHGVWGVSLFLILSGFGLTVSYTKSGLNSFFNKKIKKVLVPYSIITLICLILDKILFNKTYGIIKSVLCILGLGFKSPIDGSMWYITYLLIWYVVFYCIFKFVNNSNIRIGLLFLVSIGCFISITLLLPNTTVIRNYSLCFPIGVMIAKYFDNIKNINNKYYLYFSAIMFILFYIFLEFFSGGKDEVSIISITCFGIGTIFLGSFIHLHNLKFKVLDYLGNISYEMYLLEGVLLWKYNFLFELTQNDSINLIIYFVLLIAISLLFKIALNKGLTLFYNTINHIKGSENNISIQ